MKWLALVSIALLSGCGTLQNLSRARDYDPSKPGIYTYGGVEIAKSDLAKSWGELRETPPEPAVIPASGMVLARAIDVPATYVGDTVTWPYCYSVAFGQSYTRSLAELNATWRAERDIEPANSEQVSVP